MHSPASSAEDYLALTERVAIRRLRAGDLEQVAPFAFTVSITEPLTDVRRLGEVFAATGLWSPEAGAVGIVDLATGRLVGTSQFYRSAPCIHGFELGYILHDRADRGRGLASPAVRLFSDLLFKERPDVYR
jgi:RimJ/RimL family protein N-acetyltransferase